MKKLLTILSLTFLLGGCQPDEGPVFELPPSPAIAIGQSWSFVDDNDVKAEWLRGETDESTGTISFEMSFKDNSGISQKTNLKILIQATDRVFVKRGINEDGVPCDYEGRIWTETDLDGYEAFSESPNPDNRQSFYHIVKGTYKCSGDAEPGSWIAKINE